MDPLLLCALVSWLIVRKLGQDAVAGMSDWRNGDDAARTALREQRAREHDARMLRLKQAHARDMAVDHPYPTVRQAVAKRIAEHERLTADDIQGGVRLWWWELLADATDHRRTRWEHRQERKQARRDRGNGRPTSPVLDDVEPELGDAPRPDPGDHHRTYDRDDDRARPTSGGGTADWPDPNQPDPGMVDAELVDDPQPAPPRQPLELEPPFPEWNPPSQQSPIDATPWEPAVAPSGSKPQPRDDHGSAMSTPAIVPTPTNPAFPAQATTSGKLTAAEADAAMQEFELYYRGLQRAIQEFCSRCIRSGVRGAGLADLMEMGNLAEAAAGRAAHAKGTFAQHAEQSAQMRRTQAELGMGDGDYIGVNRQR